MRYMYEEIVEILSAKLGTYFLKNNQISFYCHKHSHHKRKLEINLEKGIFHCWVCEDGGHILKLCYELKLTDAEKKPFQELYGKKEQIIEYKKVVSTTVDSKYGKYFEENSLPFVSETSFSNINAIKNRSLNYLLRRQIDKKDIIRYSIQFGIGEQLKDSILFPSFSESGKINGVSVRFFKNPTKKYYQMRQSDSIWNELFIDWDDSLYIVEGMFDYLKVEGNKICLGGSLLNEHSSLFHKLTEHKKEKYFCMDKDAKIKSVNIIKNLLKIGIEDIFILDWQINSKQKDIGEFDSKEDAMFFIKQNLRPINQTNVNMLEIQYQMENQKNG